MIYYSHYYVRSGDYQFALNLGNEIRNCSYQVSTYGITEFYTQKIYPRGKHCNIVAQNCLLCANWEIVKDRQYNGLVPGSLILGEVDGMTPQARCENRICILRLALCTEEILLSAIDDN